MSNKTEERPSWDPIANILGFCLRNSKFVNTHGRLLYQGAASPRIDKENILCCTHIYHDISDNQSTIVLNLLFRRNFSKTIAVLDTFYFETAGVDRSHNDILQGDKFLVYYEKREVLASDIGRSLLVEVNDLSTFWTISCANDLLALFKRYDYYAKLLDCLTLFHLPD